MSLRRSFLSRRTTSRSNSLRNLSKSPEIGIAEPEDGENGGGHWSNILPELLGEIIKRVEAADDRWPLRRNLVAFGCVCKRWREVSREIVKPPVHGGKITFPSCLKQIRKISLFLMGEYLCNLVRVILRFSALLKETRRTRCFAFILLLAHHLQTSASFSWQHEDVEMVLTRST
ncbi:hypothetical protein L1987_40206 [Smallanthus sonchifolius]|uniref:Uncharacterized protein n=1 Tax=Smallanthus sonchifolius TaxID=185202 RepID=A0ACB9GSH8_9ASTR|nr:hypothetical protein L1987_40206 [Smallanthus sonchifolius]